MPMPKPRKRESQSHFISRFITDERMKKEFPRKDQRLAVAYSVWSKTKKHSKRR